MKDRVVFDCNVFAQALLNPRGPAARCLDLARENTIDLFVSEFVLDEIRELHIKLPPRAAVTAEDTEDLVDVVRTFATVLDLVPAIYDHPIDPDDSAYVNLAVAAKADTIVSRDKHLLGLVDPAKPWSRDFIGRFSTLRVLTPEQYLVDFQKEQKSTRE